MKTKFPIRFVVGPLMIAAALVWLVTSSMRASTLRVVPVEELRHPEKSDQAFVGQRLRVAGFISSEGAQKTFHKTSNGTVGASRFRVTDEKGQAALLVEYRNALPDTFRKGGPVQVDGVYEAGGTMRAEKPKPLKRMVRPRPVPIKHTATNRMAIKPATKPRLNR